MVPMKIAMTWFCIALVRGYGVGEVEREGRHYLSIVEPLSPVRRGRKRVPLADDALDRGGG
jgi:hypothetical protein